MFNKIYFNLEESLKQTLSFYETNKKFFRKISEGKDSGFDFEDFDKLDIFEKCDKEKWINKIRSSILISI